MEFDQLIFKRIYDFLIKKKPDEIDQSEYAVTLDLLHSRLLILTRAITGKSISLISSEREGGWRDETFYLPRKSFLFDSIELNLKFYFFRIFYLSIQQDLGLNWKSDEEGTVEESQERALESSEVVLNALFSEYGSMKNLYEELRSQYEEQAESVDYSWFFGRWMKNSQHYEDRSLLSEISDTTFKGDNGVKAETEIKAKQADEVEVLTVDKKAQEDYMLTHNFEKVETIDEFDGVWRDFDGDDTLSDDEQALSEHNLKHLVRVDDPVHSVYQAQMSENMTISESTEVGSETGFLSYPEWNYTTSSYRENYCKVFPEYLRQSMPDYFDKTLEFNRSIFIQLRKIFARLNNDRSLIRRQLTGDHIDIDTAIDRLADIKANLTPDDKIYYSSRKQKKELSLLFLLDLSLSSDGYAKGNRIIDIEKQVSILFGEVLNEYEIDFQIDGFYSKTRNKTTYVTLKAFDQPWHSAKLNIGSAQPQGYTRIGPAIRHAHHLLKRRDNRKKWMILLSDGKPNDYDRYEGQYGIKDIKQALRELKGDGINSYAVAIEEQAKYYLPQMFGTNHYNIISSPVEMISTLTNLYKRIERDC